MGRPDWELVKHETKAQYGIVVAKHPAAARAGIEVLWRGGNAIDAAVTTALALGVVEPAMSGLGGGGYIVYYQARTGKVFVVNYAMRAPLSAQPDFYELDQGKTVNLFAWRKVKNDANIMGATSVAVPGTVAGLSLALKEFGSGAVSWADALGPAIKLAEEGFPFDWYTLLKFANDFKLLSRYPDTAQVFLPDGGLPLVEGKPGWKPFRQTALAETLRRLASDGPDYFYKGEMARGLANYIQGQGGLLSEEDLAKYTATIDEPLSFNYGPYRLFTPNGPTGGPTLAEHLQILEALQPGGDLNDPEVWHRRIEAARLAWADRFEYLADPQAVPVPLAELTSSAYAEQRAGEVQKNGAALPYPAPPGKPRPVASPSPAFGPNAAESTTHFVVVDSEHNMVALTQTLLSLFGSGVLDPKSGVLLNNGLMWFDPEPGKPNSMGPGRRPLTNMTPTLALKNDKPVLAVGASGGRRIPNAVAQVFLGVAYGLPGIQPILDAPRFEAGQPDHIDIEHRAGKNVTDELARRGHPLNLTYENPLSGNFASPNAIRVEDDGTLSGGSERWHPGKAEGY
jgi:gamma-glutamyltranspeptidase/glutathione hydrolase